MPWFLIFFLWGGRILLEKSSIYSRKVTLSFDGHSQKLPRFSAESEGVSRKSAQKGGDRFVTSGKWFVCLVTHKIRKPRARLLRNFGNRFAGASVHPAMVGSTKGYKGQGRVCIILSWVGVIGFMVQGSSICLPPAENTPYFQYTE